MSEPEKHEPAHSTEGVVERVEYLDHLAESLAPNSSFVCQN